MMCSMNDTYIRIDLYIHEIYVISLIFCIKAKLYISPSETTAFDESTTQINR